MGWRQLWLPVIIIIHCTHYLSSHCFCFMSASNNYKCLCFIIFFNFRRGGTSEERENMLLWGQGMVGNQDTILCGLLGGWVGGLIDGWVGRSVVGWMDGWMDGWMGWWMGGCKSH